MTEINYELNIISEIINNKNIELIKAISEDWFLDKCNCEIIKTVKELNYKDCEINSENILSNMRKRGLKDDFVMIAKNNIQKINSELRIYKDTIIPIIKDRYITHEIKNAAEAINRIGIDYTKNDVSDILKKLDKKIQDIECTDKIYEYETKKYQHAEYLENAKYDPGMILDSAVLARIFGQIRNKIYIILSRPGMNKTMLLDNIFVDLAKHSNGLYFSLENDHVETCLKMAAIETGIKSNDLIFARVTPNDKRIFCDSVKAENRIWVIDKNLTIDEIISNTEIYYEKFGIKYIGIDYFQIISKKLNRISQVEYYEYCCEELVKLKKKLGIAIFILSQSNKRDHSGSGKRNESESETVVNYLGDCKGSGALEQAADVVIGLDGNINENSRNLKIIKSRLGKKDSFNIEFTPENGRIYNAKGN